MVFTNKESLADGSAKSLTGSSIKATMVGIAVVAAMLITVFITRPAATTSSFTPLSGLMTLKSMAAKTMPYEAAIASSNPTFIEFYADWCTTCQGMSATIAELHQHYGDAINFVMLDIDDPQWATQISHYGASGVPQFTLLDAHHDELNTWVGKVPKSILATVFDQLLG